MPLIPFKGKLINRTDEQLLSLFLRENNMGVIGELFGRYMHLVYGVCLKYFRNRDDSKDAVMNIFEKVSTEVARHQVTNFKSWLYVVTKNYCLMELRKTNQHTKVQPEEHISVFMEKEEEFHPIDGGREPEIENKLQDCIEKLKNGQKKCILLFYYKNRCYREIASELKIEEKKVKSYIQNGKRNLKLCLENKK